MGAKLTSEGFDEALYGGERYRTYMGTRMPRFGRANVGHLPGLFAQADAGKVPQHKQATGLSLPDDGRRLIGKNALTCVSCHAWGGNRVPGAEGLDLLRADKAPEAGVVPCFAGRTSEASAPKPNAIVVAGWQESLSKNAKRRCSQTD